MTDYVIDFACNDPDNGIFAGKAYMASISRGNVLCELEHDNWGEGVRFTALDGEFIRIHRQKFRILGSKDWVGNWCWNSYRFTYREYRRLVRALAKNGWRCTGGLARWTDAYDRIAARAAA